MNIAASTEPTHSSFGGSVAARVLHCPASVGLVEKVPAYLRKVSAYAERGTACHAALVQLIDESEDLKSLIGKTFGGYAITRDDVDLALRPVYAYVDALLNEPDAEFYLEQRVTFPTIAGAFGTVDLLVRIGAIIHVIDFKFGAGVRIPALYPDGDDDVLNAQLMFYAAAARHSLFFADVETINLTILQPQSIEPDAEMISTTPVTHAELDDFSAVYRVACEDALSDTPHLERGAWCRFCPAKPICPAHTGPLLDLAQFAAPTLRDTLVASLAAPPGKAAYLELIAKGLDLLDAVKDLRATLHDQAKAALENGDIVPGYTLSAGRAERRWRDESAVLAILQSLGFYYDDVMKAETRSPKQVELRAKARGLEVPKDLIVSHRSGVSLVRSENAHVPVPGRGELARTFSAALEAFGGRQA
jgi:hypothetical protein